MQDSSLKSSSYILTYYKISAVIMPVIFLTGEKLMVSFIIICKSTRIGYDFFES